MCRQISVYSFYHWATVVAQLVDQSLLTPEDQGSNPVVFNFIKHLLTVNCVEKSRKGRGNDTQNYLFKTFWASFTNAIKVL